MPKITTKQSIGRPLKVLVPIRDWAADVGQWMIDYMDQNNRIATGKSIASINVQVTKPNVVVINASESVKFALGGRKRGRFPNVEAIKRWIVAKNGKFGFRWDKAAITLNSLAYLIGRKIAKKGTNKPKLTAQNIGLTIESKSQKYLERAGQIFAQESSDAWMKSITKAGNPNVKVK